MRDEKLKKLIEEGMEMVEKAQKKKKVGEVYHDVITNEEINKKIEKAIKFYKETMFKEPDKILKTVIKFPRILLPNGKVIDIEKEYKNGKVISTMIGVVPFIVYLSDKGGEFNIYFHEFKPYQCFLAVDPEDTSRVFLTYTEEIKFDEGGIE